MDECNDAVSVDPIKELTKADIMWKLARLVRNTDGLHPSTWGPLAGQLLVQLRQLDGERYDREVITPRVAVVQDVTPENLVDVIITELPCTAQLEDVSLPTPYEFNVKDGE